MDSSKDDPYDTVDLTISPRAISPSLHRRLRCVNRKCEHGDGLRDAIELICSYFNVDYKRGKEVCSYCYNQCLSHYKRLEEKWVNGQCILKSKFPSFASYQIIESSESESSSTDDDEEQRPSTSTSVLKHVTPKDDVKATVKNLVEEWFNVNQSFITNHVNMCDEYMNEVVKSCYTGMAYIDKNVRDLDREVYELRKEIYQPFESTIEFLPPVDLTEPNSKRAKDDIGFKQIKKPKINIEVNVAEENNCKLSYIERVYPSPDELPILGPQIYPNLNEGDWVFTVKTDLLGPWRRGKIQSLINEDYMHVRFGLEEKLFTTKEVAYSHQNTVQFTVGARVIAKCNNTPITLNSEFFFAGIIGEPPKANNQFRYLIFYDGGFVEYRCHKDIRLIVHKSLPVWNDVHSRLKEFIQSYLEDYPGRQMVKLIKHHSVRVLLDDRWQAAKVVEVDASLVKLYFPDIKKYEWIYRGSTRLWKIYEKEVNSGKGKHLRQSGLAYLNKPFIEFSSVEEPESKSVTPKSILKQPSTSLVINTSPKQQKKVDDDQLYETHLIKLPKTRPKKFVAHVCNYSCVKWTRYDYSKTKRISMLAIPLFFGFFRTLIHFNKKSQKCVAYVTPCGVIARNMKEMLEYLNVTKSKMTIDQFDFNSWVNPRSEFRVLKSKKFINDISDSKEFRGISCVNCIDLKLPPPMVYMTSRQPMPGVNINLESDFLCGCDCTDNCQDKSKCACWQLTIEGQKILPYLYKDPKYIGYNHRRLPERVLTGIYECNKTCKCSSSCLNRVVQFPLSQKLQLFLTEKKGWGVRCLNDVPQGSFLCIYVGYLLTEADANEGGKNYGDEYLAELDYIEVVEKIKEDYESDIPFSDQENSDSTDESFKISETSDEDYQSTSEAKSSTSDISLRLRKRKNPKNDTKTKKNDRHNVSELNPYRMKINSDPPKSAREYFGENESVYIMDAKSSGNIGRYLNHSCSPNTFVQNVFVDTHDLRFPWISFFALHYIPAGTELTWDYSYDVGSVPGKTMKCHCESVHCRGRLL